MATKSNVKVQDTVELTDVLLNSLMTELADLTESFDRVKDITDAILKERGLK